MRQRYICGIVFSLLLACNALLAQRPEPFGFRVHMTQQQVIAAVGTNAIERGYPKTMFYGSVLSLTNAPRPNRAFDSYAIKFSKEGAFEVAASSPAIQSASDGTQVREKFDELKSGVTTKYGAPECFDNRSSGSSKYPEFFMMYLEEKEQTLDCFWHAGEDSIMLEAVGINMRAAMLKLVYQYGPETRRAKVVADNKDQQSY